MRKRLSVAVAAMILACAISPAAVWAEKSPTTDTTVTNEESAENDIETPDLDEQGEQDVQDEQDEQDEQDLLDAQDEQDVQDEQNEQDELDELDEQDLLDAPAVYGASPTSTTTVATINEQSYNSLQAAIDDAKDGQEIVLQSDVELTTGLKFSGTQGASIDTWKNFIINANGKNLTLKEFGMHAKFCNVTIKNCPELTILASKNPGENEGVTANLFAYANLTLDACDKVLIQNDEAKVCGSGLYINERGSLYVQNKTNLTVTGYMGDDNTDASGIYADTINKDPNYLVGDLVVSGGSTLTATRCVHNGITVNPMNITVTGNSVLDVNNNNDGWYGEGGLGCYYGKLTISDHSHVTAYKNTAWGFAIFVKDLEVDGTSEIDAVDNGSYLISNGGLGWAGNGITIAGNGVLHNGATMSASGNWGPGVSTHIDVNRGFMGGSLTVENGATLTSTKNYNYGLANGKTLNINTGARVYLSENYSGGLDNYPAATTTVDEKADLVITNNYGVGINNGNNTDKDYLNVPFTASDANVATLILKSGTITENHANTKMPSPIPQLPELNAWVDYGGGICNRYGTVDISAKTKIYNNYADTTGAGDDLYNYPLDATAAAKNTIWLTIPGAVWEKLNERDGGGIIDNWYDDSENNRWNAATHAVICEDSKSSYRFTLPDGQPAWKAAHGAVAPTPSPSPTPEATATPVPTNEPSPVPSASPVPSTPMPSAVPTAAPTAAPVQPTTAPVAPVTRVDATATPAPTDAPTQQPTTAPAATAQPTATIPQTGDAAPLALFGGLTISSAAAFYFLRKRRKSE